MNKQQKSTQSIFIVSTSIVCGMLALLAPDWKRQLLASYEFEAEVERAKIVKTTKAQAKATQSTVSAKISEIPDAELNTIGSRLTQVRRGSPETTTNHAAAGDNFDRLGVFINGNYTFGEGLGFEQDGAGTTLGADYRFTDNLVLGVVFAYNHTEADFDNSQGNMDTDALSGALYGSFFTENGFYIDGVFSGKSVDYEIQRNISNTSVIGENSGTKYNVNVSGGYDVQINGLTLTPQLRVNYSNNHIEAMDERGAADLILHYGEQNFDSLKTSLGAQLSYPLSFSWGVLMPTISADWTHEFFYSPRTIDAHFIQDSGIPSNAFEIVTNGLEKDFMNLGVGASAQLKHGVSMFVNYDTILAHKYIESHLFTAGVRVEF